MHDSALALAVAAAAVPAAFPGVPSQYRGFPRVDFSLDGCPCTVVMPRHELPGRPWIWRAEFFDAFPQIDLALLAEGFHLAYMNVGNTFGCPSAMRHFDVFYEAMTGTYGLAAKPVLEGLSRGGLYVYAWGAAHPDRVLCILGDNPVCDFKSWPGGRGTGPGSPRDWAKLIGDYGFASEQAALDYGGNPIDRLEPLAAHGVPLIHLCGDADEVVPYPENTVILAERYRRLGGAIDVLVKPGQKHHPHGLEDPAPAVRMILDVWNGRPLSGTTRVL
ncbi:MAG: alpha/beta hydrolase [Lentisphaerae bacterium]|nr:alpha/beta hydrolase [Lentisphaerota bacterium]